MLLQAIQGSEGGAWFKGLGYIVSLLYLHIYQTLCPRQGHFMSPPWHPGALHAHHRCWAGGPRMGHDAEKRCQDGNPSPEARRQVQRGKVAATLAFLTRSFSSQLKDQASPGGQCSLVLRNVVASTGGTAQRGQA